MTPQKQLQPSQPAHAVVDDIHSPAEEALVDQVVRELNHLLARVTLEAALDMGRIIVGRFYGGDLTAWRQHRAKEASFRRLAARADRDLQVSPTQLYRAVALYELTQRLRIDPSSSNLSMTHLRIVIGLPEKTQTELLATAEAMRWTTQRLEREAAKVRGTMSRRTGGRTPSPPALKAARHLVRTWHQLESALIEQPMQRLSVEELRSLYRAVDEVRSRLELVARRLGQSGAVRTLTAV
jgi:hypothetical protein